jgi:hypothetical protein
MINVNIDKAKEISHEVRRAKRNEEFAPLDIKATIPYEAESAETERQVIRDKYATIQANIDSAANTDELKTILVDNELI